MSFIKTNGVDFNSTNIQRINYDSSAQTLSVTFESGRTYRWDAVDSFTTESLESAESKTRFLNESIKNKFATIQADVP